MIKPVNGHLLIEPLKQDTFMAHENGVYQEIGVIISIPNENYGAKQGDKVYFDSWLAAKYPTGKGNDFYWLVKWDDVRAIEENDEVPK